MTALARILRLSALVVAVCSAFAGAVTALLPALVVGLVTLFYNSAGGALIFLGNLVSLLPHPLGDVHGTSSLPVFQQLGTNTDLVVFRSAAAAILCSIAVVVAVAPTGVRNGRRWLAMGLCCVFAAIVGGRSVGFCVIPAIAISIAHLARQQMRRGGRAGKACDAGAGRAVP